MHAVGALLVALLFPLHAWAATITLRVTTGSDWLAGSSYTFTPTVHSSSASCTATSISDPDGDDVNTVTASCSFAAADISQVRIPNMGSNAWQVAKMELQINGAWMLLWAVNLSPPAFETWIDDDGGSPEHATGIWEMLPLRMHFTTQSITNAGSGATFTPSFISTSSATCAGTSIAAPAQGASYWSVAGCWALSTLARVEITAPSSDSWEVQKASIDRGGGTLEQWVATNQAPPSLTPIIDDDDLTEYKKAVLQAPNIKVRIVTAATPASADSLHTYSPKFISKTSVVCDGSRVVAPGLGSSILSLGVCSFPPEDLERVEISQQGNDGWDISELYVEVASVEQQWWAINESPPTRGTVVDGDGATRHLKAIYAIFITPAPATPAPETPAPPTAQPTLSPPTTAPSTPAPATPAPATPAPATPAPATPAPATPAPATPAPATPAPATPAPATPAPATPAPATPAPATPAPATPAPATPAPATPAPATPAPATPAPATPAPATPAPATPAPATPAPATPAPATPAPATPAPATPAPATPAPATTAPATASPATPAPATPAPATSAPATPAPATPVPLTSAPVTPSPDTPAPATPAPATSAPATPSPTTPAPATPSPATPAPVTPAPATPAPSTTVPATPSPATPAPATSAPATGIPGVPPTLAPPTATPTNPPDTQAPATSAPSTPAPATPAPSTPAPATSAPSTPAPATSVPATGIPGIPPTLAPPTATPTNPPDTQAPATSAPSTPAPATSAPSTLVPVTPSPATPVPVTPVPSTPSPATLAPATAVPSTPAPVTAAPHTPSPPTSAPATPAPATLSPATFVPDTMSPPTASPATLPTFVPTTSVPTSPPATTTPETFSPATQPPATGSPPTVPPATTSPLATSAPSTLAPTTGSPAGISATGTPGTPAPSMLTPTTDIPATDTRATPAPEVGIEDTISSVGTVATGAAALGGAGGAGAATRLVLVSGACTGNGADRRFPFPLHPTGITVGGSEAAGAVVGNLGIMIGFTLLMRGVLEVLKRAGTKFLSRVMEGADTQGLLRFPSVPLFVFTWLYQGTALGGMVLVMHPQGAGSVVGGLVTLVACVVAPVSLFYVVVRDIPSKAVYMKDSEERGWLFTLFCGPGEWVSVGGELHWVNRYASVTRTFLQDKAWFFVIEYGSSFALAAIGTLNTETFSGCGHVKMAMALVFMVTVMLEAVLWPHARPRDNVMDFIALGAQVAALLLMAMGYYRGKDIGEHGLHKGAELLFMTAAILLLVKVAMDLGTELYILVKGRRRRLQRAAWEKTNPFEEEMELPGKIPSPASPTLSESTFGVSLLEKSASTKMHSTTTGTGTGTTRFTRSTETESHASQNPNMQRHLSQASAELAGRRRTHFTKL